MKPLSIFLVRHGESLGNVDRETYKTIPDWKIPLTEKGVLQAKEAGEKLALKVYFDSIKRGRNMFAYYCSPWLRTRQTAQNLKDSLESFYPSSLSIFREDPRIREQEWGNYQEEELYKKIKEERREFGSFYYRMPFGESGADVYDRVTTFIDTLHRDFKKEDFPANAIIISHGLAIKAFLMRWFHWSSEEFDRIDTPDNCSIIEMNLQKDNRYRLVTELQAKSD